MTPGLKRIGANPEGESGPGGPPSEWCERVCVSKLKKGPYESHTCRKKREPHLRLSNFCGAYGLSGLDLVG